MSRRCLASMGALAVVVVVVSLVSVSIAGQAPKDTRAPAAVALDKAKASLGKAYTQPKTPWGDPDLQGDRKSTRLNSSHSAKSRMPSSA